LAQFIIGDMGLGVNLISVIAQAASKDEASFKSGQKRLKNNYLTLFV